jgi:hypothetical protein
MQSQAIEPADRPGPEGANDTSRPISHVLSLHPFWKMVVSGPRQQPALVTAASILRRLARWCCVCWSELSQDQSLI